MSSEPPAEEDPVTTLMDAMRANQIETEHSEEGDDVSVARSISEALDERNMQAPTGEAG